MLRNRSLASGAAMALLSLVWACQALGPDLLPGAGLAPSSSLLAESIPFALLAVGFAGISTGRRWIWPAKRQIWRLIWIGLGLFVLPELLVRMARTGTSAYARTVVLTLVPIFAVVLEPYLAPSLGEGELKPVPGAVGASLVSTAGALLVFPVEVPGTLSACLAFGLLVLAAMLIAGANCLAYSSLVFIGSDRQKDGGFLGRSSWVPALAVVLGSSAFGLGLLDRTLAALSLIDIRLNLVGALSRAAEWNWKSVAVGVGVEMLAILSLIGVIVRMRPLRAATRYLFAPLVTILLGVVLMRVGGSDQASLQPRTWFGLVWMAGGALYLLCRGEATESSVPSLRG